MCKEFLRFNTVSSTNAETITTAIVAFLQNCGIDIQSLVGKGFDGAANMNGHVSVVFAILADLYQTKKYFTHFRNHALNLVIVASCNKVPFHDCI